MSVVFDELIKPVLYNVDILGYQVFIFRRFLWQAR
jgi:hypothetical protein